MTAYLFMPARLGDEQSTAAIIAHHKDAKYDSIGKSHIES
jgi:hypothetical protein